MLLLCTDFGEDVAHCVGKHIHEFVEERLVETERAAIAHGAAQDAAQNVFAVGVAWLDAGTHESLLQAATFIEAIQQRQGLMISCPEEIAYHMGYINKIQLEKLGKALSGNSYGEYILEIAGGE